MHWFLLGALVAVGWIARSARAGTRQVSERLDAFRRESLGKDVDTEELSREVDQLKKMVALLAGGRRVTPEMVREGRLFENATVDDIQRELDAGGRPYVLDVRSDQEWAGGRIPGAVHVPVDQVERRLHEVARDGRKLYVICAGGGRSAQAAEYLANRGYLNVHNVQGGMNSWRGPIER